MYNVPLLKNKAIEFISQYPERVMRTPGWTLLLKQAPDVCTHIICRLSRIGSLGGNAGAAVNSASGGGNLGGDVTVVKATRSSSSSGGNGNNGGGNGIH